MSNESPESLEIIPEIAHSLAEMISGIDNIPLPPVIKKSLWQALSTLITGVVDVPGAWLEGKAQVIRAEAAGRSLLTIESAKAAAKRFSSDEKLIDRSMVFFCNRILKEQRNREQIFETTIKELSSTPPTEDSKQGIDEDWLDMFSRIAEQRSNEDMQLYLARLLAGEIKKPGSFQPSTVEVLSKLTPELAQIFQHFCNISMVVAEKVEDGKIHFGEGFPFILAEPYGAPAQNALKDLGFSYVILTQLQDAGLIQNDLSAFIELPIAVFILPIKIGDQVFHFTSKQPSQEMFDKNRKLKIINFTTAGRQLRQIIDKMPNGEYINKTKEWVKLIIDTQ